MNRFNLKKTPVMLTFCSLRIYRGNDITGKTTFTVTKICAEQFNVNVKPSVFVEINLRFFGNCCFPLHGINK